MFGVLGSWLVGLVVFRFGVAKGTFLGCGLWKVDFAGLCVRARAEQGTCCGPVATAETSGSEREDKRNSP